MGLPERIQGVGDWGLRSWQGVFGQRKGDGLQAGGHEGHIDIDRCVLVIEAA